MLFTILQFCTDKNGHRSGVCDAEMFECLAAVDILKDFYSFYFIAH